MRPGLRSHGPAAAAECTNSNVCVATGRKPGPECHDTSSAFRAERGRSEQACLAECYAQKLTESIAYCGDQRLRLPAVTSRAHRRHWVLSSLPPGPPTVRGAHSG